MSKPLGIRVGRQGTATLEAALSQKEEEIKTLKKKLKSHEEAKLQYQSKIYDLNQQVMELKKAQEVTGVPAETGNTELIRNLETRLNELETENKLLAARNKKLEEEYCS
ncbi:myosin-11-like [Watersipora subatra]|uniref:myosin-11-like n=1 Tax=Watersipora subatra TaxID=2589382 RepID=UPI00355C0081